MTAPFPLYADPIFVEWITREGGVGATAYTDRKGIPFLGIYPLNRMGKPNGLPCWFQRSRLMSNVVIGFRNETPIVIHIDAQVTAQGLELVIALPVEVEASGFRRRLFAAWGSEQPRLGFIVAPANFNWPADPFPTKEE